MAMVRRLASRTTVEGMASASDKGDQETATGCDASFYQKRRQIALLLPAELPTFPKLATLPRLIIESARCLLKPQERLAHPFPPSVTERPCLHRAGEEAARPNAF